MQLINELVGQKVTIYSEQGEAERQDIGLLETSDAVWLRLRKADNEVLYFCIHRIRMIKAFGP